MDRYAKAKIFTVSSPALGKSKTHFTCKPLAKGIASLRQRAKGRPVVHGGRLAELYEIVRQPDFAYVLVEEYPCDNIDELRRRLHELDVSE